MHWHKRPIKEYNEKKRLGLVHVYTGEGKGKTTAALGVALRSLGHGHRVLVIQFIKGHKDYGELLALQQLKGDNLDIVQFGTHEPTDLRQPSAMDTYLAQQGMTYARKQMEDARPDVLILDEINPAVHHALVAEHDILDFIDNAHQETEIILTGRNAPPSLLNAADLITVMTATRHPYDEEFFPRKGIEH